MKHLLLSGALIVLSLSFLRAQAGDDRLRELQNLASKDGEGWVVGGALGLDFAQLAMFNPRVGSGDNRIALGGLGNVYGNYKKGRHAWLSNASLQLAVQKLADAEWQKSLDLLRLNSKYSYQTASANWSVGSLLTMESLAMPTYPGNFLRRKAENDLIQAKFLSPARFEFSLGINYKPDAYWNFFFSPSSYKVIYVGDQEIANLGIHGTQLRDANDPSEGYRRSFHQVGARLVGTYQRKFLEDKLSYSSRLDLFSNYLREPQNMDVLWQNDLGWQLWKNISLNVLLEAFYDHDIQVLRKRPSESLPQGELGRQTSWTQAVLIKYNLVF